MAVGVGERTGIAPRLLPGLDDDLCTGLTRTLDELVDARISPGAQPEHTFALLA